MNSIKYKLSLYERCERGVISKEEMNVLMESVDSYSYKKIKTDEEIKMFHSYDKEVFNAKKNMDKNMVIKSIQQIFFNNELIGYIGFSRFNEDGKKYLGIGDFMVIPKYQSSGHGTKIIKDIIERNKDEYDEIYCYVEKVIQKLSIFIKR